MKNPKLSAVATSRPRNHRGHFLPTTSPQEARITELEVSNAYNGAEVSRLAESLRLAEMGRDKALADLSRSEALFRATECRLVATQRAATRRLEIIDALGNDKDALVWRIEELTETAEEYKSRIAELEEARRMGEFRYIALQRQRAIEIAIVVIAAVGTLLFAGIAVVMGGAK